ncbi:hypothetical protein I5M27_00920 [Adhaeribacter sp. BT258]|uniref:Outer membrane protein beta-barrel domain-containing protein n=1 Tax=Adhaeribacter terrigena TaxID=2793070 RepID=A0ABS1BYQ8_9BACT|nr:hypothetical protein [Adhaeribacter terrigena]MBK0401523.1 hypothetical protein [Adhaeribacter terrigena]
MRNFLVLMCVLSCCTNVLAQKILSLKPFIGRQTPICRFDKNFPAPDGLSVKPLRMEWSPGILLALKLNSNWTVQSGIAMGWTGWHLKDKKSDANFSDRPDGLSAFHQTNQVQLLVQRRITTVNTLNISPGRDNYLLNFDLYLTAGLIYSIIPRYGSQADSTIFKRYMHNGKPESNFSYHKFLHRHSNSIYIGLGTQFYSRNNARFDLTLYYSQGLTDVMEIEVDYRQNDDRYKAKLRTRGSVFGATLAYPIRLKTFERKSV